jgi:hypothetical protein
MLPDGFYDLSQFGKGQYRIDGKMSVGHFDNIYIIFQANGVRDPGIVSGANRIHIHGQGPESHVA